MWLKKQLIDDCNEYIEQKIRKERLRFALNQKLKFDPNELFVANIDISTKYTTCRNKKITRFVHTIVIENKEHSIDIFTDKPESFVYFHDMYTLYYNSELGFEIVDEDWDEIGIRAFLNGILYGDYFKTCASFWDGINKGK